MKLMDKYYSKLVARTGWTTHWLAFEASLVKLYIESLDLGHPDPTLEDPQIRVIKCDQCKDDVQEKMVTLYMVNCQVSKKITFCKCPHSLASVLVANQFMPSSTIAPQKGIHFSVFEMSQLIKTKFSATNSSIIQFYNDKIRHAHPTNYRPMTMDFNKLFGMYRRLMLGLSGSTQKFVTMDGNSSFL